MQYFDKNGKEIKAGMKILMEDGSIEMVYDTEDQYGNPNLGINASNEEFLKLHPIGQESIIASLCSSSQALRCVLLNRKFVPNLKNLPRSSKAQNLPWTMVKKFRKRIMKNTKQPLPEERFLHRCSVRTALPPK